MIKWIKSHKKIAILCTLICFLIVFALLELTGRTSLILDRGPEKVTDTTSKTTSNVESAQSDFTGGNTRKPKPSTEKPAADVNDTKGTGVQATASPSTSSDGQVTVYTPSKNTVVTNGSSLTGKTSGSTISFRVIDNVSGVIATGSLAVVNGNFSAAFNFSTSATQGRIDVFQTKPDLTEHSVVEIPVRFK